MFLFTLSKLRGRQAVLLAGTVLVMLLAPRSAAAMHIMEGFLPWGWSLFWTGVSLPFVLLGFRSLNRLLHTHPNYKMLLGLAAAFVFVISALKMPSVTGSCSHPTGVGLGTILFGPLAMTVLSSIVLIFQALLLAHGGITTLGANIFSMGIAGPLAAFVVFMLGQKAALPRSLSIFLAVFMASMVTYLATSMQLALAFPMETGGVIASFVKFAAIFAVTQIPLAVGEGILTLIIFNVLYSYNNRELAALLKIKNEVQTQ
ncbi:MAG: energy-coupling factor ABC transporter permease [Bacillota bacterium]